MENASPEEYDDRASEIDSGEDERELKVEDSLGSPSALSNATGKPHTSKPAHLQKRRRVTRACDECRRKKIKCDGKQPCTHCTVYSYECTYDQPSNRRRNPAPQYVENLEHRVHRAETLLHILIPNLDLNDPGIDAAVAQGWIPGAPGKGHPGAAQPPPSRQPRPSIGPSAEHKSDTNLESMVRAVAQMDIDEQGNWDYHGHSSGLSFMRRMREQLGDLLGPDNAATPFVKSRPSSQVLDSPRSMNAESPSFDPSSPGVDLPPRDIARTFCSNAIDDAAALLKFVHKPTFWHSFERVYASPSEQWGNEEQRFLPLLYSAMALGTLFGKDEHSNLNQIGYENATQQGFAYFKAARQLMDIADCRDLTSVQSVVFMILFMQSSAKLSQCYAYVGVALRSALRMGLHRAYAGNFDPIESETRKRTFWVIRKMDVYIGAMLGLPQTLNDLDVDQEFPAEVDDEFITRDGILPMPEGQVSLLTAFNAHTRLCTVIQKIVRKVYPIKVQNRQGEADKSYTVPFSVIREIESDLEHWKNTLPSVLSPCDAPERYLRVQQLLRLAYAHAQVLLYRPFLHFTATEKRSKPVDQRAYACAASYVNVSRNIIHITQQMKQKGLLNGAFWFTMYTTFFSILSLVYFAAENPDNPTTDAVMKDASEGREILASLATRSMAADRCTATLNIIFSRLSDWMRTQHSSTTSKKRQLGPTPIAQPGRPKAAHSHPDVSSIADREPPGPGSVRRASTFPEQGTTPKSESDAFQNTHWNGPAGPAPYGQATPNGFDQQSFDLPPMTSSNSLPNEMQNHMTLPPNFAMPAVPEVSAIMFPDGSNEPLLYPNQPLTTFENNQQYAAKNNPYINNLARGGNGMDSNVNTPQAQAQQLLQTPSRAAPREDNMEAQFFALPPYLETARQQQQQQQPQRSGGGMNFSQDNSPFGARMPGGHRQQGMPQMQNGWPGQQQQQQQQPQYPFGNQQNGQDFSNINIQDLFGGAEWNAMIMDPGFRQ